MKKNFCPRTVSPSAHSVNRPMKTRNYPPEFREQAVKLYPQSGLSFEQIAEKVGIAGETVRRWVSQHLATLPEEQAKLAAAAAEENKMLRKENARLQEEVTILKKAAVYFAKESIQSSSMPLLKQNVPPIL